MHSNRPKSPSIGGRTRRHAPPKVAGPPFPTISDGHQILPQCRSQHQQQLSILWQSLILTGRGSKLPRKLAEPEIFESKILPIHDVSWFRACTDMISIQRASKPLKDLRPIWSENGESNPRSLAPPSLVWGDILMATSLCLSWNHLGLEEKEEGKKMGPVARPEVAGPARNRLEKGHGYSTEKKVIGPRRGIGFPEIEIQGLINRPKIETSKNSLPTCVDHNLSIRAPI